MRLERAQLGLLAALAATIPVSIFASETLLALVASLVLAARLAARRRPLRPHARSTRRSSPSSCGRCSPPPSPGTRCARTRTRRSSCSSRSSTSPSRCSPGTTTASACSAPRSLGGLALAGLMVLQRHFLGYDRLDRRPRGLPRPLHVGLRRDDGRAAARRRRASRSARGPRPRAAGFALPRARARRRGRGRGRHRGGPRGARRRGPAWRRSAPLAAAVALLAERRGAGRPSAALPAVVVPVAAWALVVSQTRSAWVGAARRPRRSSPSSARRASCGWWAAAILAVLVLRPAAVTERLTIGDASSRDRYYMWQAGLDMVLDKPVFGQGPGMILAEYPRYRWPEATAPACSPTSTTTSLQIAAERGLPGLAFLLWWAVVALRGGAARGASRARPGAAARAGRGGRARGPRRGLRGGALRIQSRRLRGPDARACSSPRCRSRSRRERAAAA